MGKQETSALIAQEPSKLEIWIASFAPQIAAALDGVLSEKKFIQVAVNAVMGNEKLEQSTPHSLMSSLLQAAEVQLFPGSAHGYAYLVPYYSKKESAYICQFMLGYRGILALCHRSPKILKVEAHTVHDGDEFSLTYGLEGGLQHKPQAFGVRNTKTLIGVYAIAYLANGTTQFETLSAEELAALRKRSKGQGTTPWDTDTLAMCTKSAVRKLARWLPLEPKDQAAINKEERDDIVAESGARYVSTENEDLRNRLESAKPDAPELVREMDELLDREPEAQTETEADSNGWVPND